MVVVTENEPELTEYGFCLRRDSSQNYNRLLLSGLGRSGTSAVASLFKHAGYYIGKVDGVASNEDKLLRRMFKEIGYDRSINKNLKRFGGRSLHAWHGFGVIGKAVERLMFALSVVLSYAGLDNNKIKAVVSVDEGLLRAILRGSEYDIVINELLLRSKEYSLLAWKDPKLIGKAGRMLIKKLPDDWAVVLSSRDPVAIAHRLAKQHGEDVVDAFSAVMERQLELLEVIKEVAPKTVFVVSYEKLVSAPEKVIASLMQSINPVVAESINPSDIWGEMMRDHVAYVAVADSDCVVK